MIVPMQKVFLVVQDKYRKTTMTRLREIGIVHIENSDAGSNELFRAREHKAWVEDAIILIKSLVVFF
jgi:V/A-type H+-transporting ATPase subunit I